MQTEKENWNLDDSAPAVTGGQIYVAFPGLGKTTYARQHCNVVDLDFGTYRSARKVLPADGAKLYPEFSRYIKYWYKDGYKVLTNDYGLIPLIKQFAERNIVMELPEKVDELVARVVAREEKRSVNPTFARALASNAEYWVRDWLRAAVKYNIPVIHTRYFKEVTMPYESSTK